MCIRDSITATTAEAEDYTGEDGLLYCGKCHTPKEAYFPKETAQWLGHDRHPAECDCQRAAREKREAAESRQKHLETVEDLKRRGFTDPAMRNWTFEHDNGRNPQTATARFYVESWETMQAENIGYLFWGCLLYTSGCDRLCPVRREVGKPPPALLDGHTLPQQKGRKLVKAGSLGKCLPYRPAQLRQKCVKKKA